MRMMRCGPYNHPVIVIMIRMIWFIIRFSWTDPTITTTAATIHRVVPMDHRWIHHIRERNDDLDDNRYVIFGVGHIIILGLCSFRLLPFHIVCNVSNIKKRIRKNNVASDD
jgi:hypothetical protein